MSNTIVISLISLVLISFAGCTIPTPTEKSVDEIIVREQFYTTEIGKSLCNKYRDRLVDIINEIRGSFRFNELEFTNPKPGANAQGIYFGYVQTDENKKIYLCIDMYTTTQYNTLQSNYNSRAATVFTAYGRILFDKAYKSGITRDENVCGIAVDLYWYAKSFITSQGDWEGMSINAERENVKQFLNNEITDQHFIGKARVYGGQGGNPFGLIEVDLSERM